MTTVASKPDATLRELAELNENYVRSVAQSDVGWFDRNLADDFLNTNPDTNSG